MNPQYPVPNSNFYFNPLNPPQNPIPNFSNPQFNWTPPPQFPPLQLLTPPPPPPPPPPQPQAQNPLSDLPNSLSSLKTLIQSSKSTLQSFSSLFPSLSISSNSLVQCPSNPHHWVPSTSLFLHSLSCPSALDIGLVVETLQYPKTLNNDQHLVQDNKFVLPLNDPTSELCFSIDDYVDFESNFFYQDCPGVVSSLSSDASKRIFTLPGVLSVECANYVGCSDKESVGFGGSSVKVLPSEVWFIGREVEQWSDYPGEYSLSVGRALLCVECVKECDLPMWVIENSPRFGVVVDVPMRDHMFILFRLCLKAIVKEAAHSYGSLLTSDVNGGSRKFNLRSLNLKCPVMVEVLRWLKSQLSILYGEINSRSLIFAMLKQLLSKAASNSSLFRLERKSDQAYGNERVTDTSRGQSSGNVTENDGNDSKDEGMFCRPIFVHQIAAAIAALHERSLLEDRIRALRNPPQLTPYQRLSEYSYLSKKADEERHKRPDYKPLIEHDGLLNHRQQDKGNNKLKTKEELLAEERDYKRRRMSYRGKKLKRSTKEVMRDIIEDYMEAIKHTGGIGGPAKGETEKSLLTSTNSSAPNVTSSKLNRSSQSNTQDNYRTLLDDDYQYHETDSTHASRRPERQKKESHSHGHAEDQRTRSTDRRYRDYYSRSPSSDRRRSRSREQRSQSRNQVVRETSEDEPTKRRYSSSNRSSHHDYKSYNSARRSSRVSYDRKDKRKVVSPDRQRWPKNEYGRSDSFGSVEINDRYDPAESSHDDDQYSNYTRATS